MGSRLTAAAKVVADAAARAVAVAWIGCFAALRSVASASAAPLAAERLRPPVLRSWQLCSPHPQPGLARAEVARAGSRCVPLAAAAARAQGPREVPILRARAARPTWRLSAVRDEKTTRESVGVRSVCYRTCRQLVTCGLRRERATKEMPNQSLFNGPTTLSGKPTLTAVTTADIV